MGNLMVINHIINMEHIIHAHKAIMIALVDQCKTY
jgi:hypothetical protein